MTWGCNFLTFADLSYLYKENICEIDKRRLGSTPLFPIDFGNILIIIYHFLAENSYFSIFLYFR